MSTERLLDLHDREQMLRQALHFAKPLHRRGPLWVFVRDFLRVGSTTAKNICRELGWDPDVPALRPLPLRRRATSEETTR